MSRQNVDDLRGVLEAFGAGDREALLAMLAPDVVWDTSRSAFPEAGLYRGREGVRKWFGGLGEAFGEDIRYELREIRDLGDAVLVDLRARAHGRSTRIGVDWSFVAVFTFRDDKVVRMDRYAAQAEALRELGLAQ